MSALAVVVTVAAAAAAATAAALDVARPPWLLANMERLGVPQPALLPLGALKAAGAAGLACGFLAAPLGVAAAIGLVLFFLGAIATVVRARWWGHLPVPAFFLLLCAAALAAQVTA